MPTTIRLKRGGRTHSPYYRIVVIDSRNRNRGREVDIIGVYHPVSKPEPLTRVDVQKALEWLRKGAQPSDTARNVLARLGVMKHFHDGSTPEEPLAEFKGGVVEQKGYTPPAPPKEDPKPEPVVEETATAEEAPAGEAPVAEAAPETTETAEPAESAPETTEEPREGTD
ncbi:MAG: 30S ribosomal protein S16 [Candidatus Hydrogenedentes bacterium]|nr:30S ribosomal protein S16 [Candidatus Hydrogenedentota bacterium]